ncbi:ATP-dependent DNA helicase PIF1-like [Achlya hypogyna]|uniref:ATP-dependent DNA helicase n=1 Tax=Achlya hypogyna TaxID=1202772 RepID=A0A1V9ZI74_ACHHY|nr:ATP-dependent DNA helicase PIF1-like [Achlya hypogyna]
MAAEGFRCDIEIQVACARTGQRRSSKAFRNVAVLKRMGGLQVYATGYKTAIRAPSTEVYSSQVQRGKLAFIKRADTTFTQYNLSNGQPDDLIELRDFAIAQGAQSKSIINTDRSKKPATPSRAPLVDRSNHLLQTPSPTPTKKLSKKRKAEPSPKVRALHSTQMTKRSRVQLTSEQQEIIESVARKENVFFTGRAGTGKSYLLRQLQKRLPSDGLYSTATTGIAAYHIPKVLIIDEISMLDGRLFELLEGVARRIRKSKAFFGGIQLILSGDFYQLPPVNDDKQAIFCFEAPSWDDGIKATFSLNQVFRQKDDTFITILNAIREGQHTQSMLATLNQNVEVSKDLNPTQEAQDDAIHIFTHNADVLQVRCYELQARELVGQMNQKHLHALSGVAHEYTAKDRGPREYLMGCPVPTRVVLKKHVKVMLTKTISVASGLVNGSRGVILGFTPDGMLPFVRFTNGVSQVVPLEEFSVLANDTVIASRQQVCPMIPLTLAYGISIHKSQGLTFDCAVLHLAKVFEYGQAYVALSRVSSLQGRLVAKRTSTDKVPI